MLDGSVDAVVAYYLNADAVGYVQARGLTQVLQAVDQFACHTFLNQFGGELDIQGDRQYAIVHHEPAGHIFGQNLNILGCQAIVDCGQLIVAFGFHLRYLILTHGTYLSGNGFHLCAYLFAEYLEVWLDLLYEPDLRFVSRNDNQLLDIHLRTDEICHVLQGLQGGVILNGNDGFLQRLAYVLLCFLAQG